MSTPPAIRIDNLVKEYAPPGPGEPPKLALKGVSFDVPQGGVFGLLGPNGAGKSTLINILAGLVRKTAGSAEIWGFDIDENPRNAKRSIGIVPQEIVFDPFFTPFEVLENQGGFYGIAKALRRSEELLAAVHLADKRDAYARTLSGGMKRRVMIAKALSHDPELLFLDEPTAGVDVELRRDMWRQIDALRTKGVTIILTTHYIEEAEEMADRVGVIRKGKILMVDDKASMMRRLGSTEAVIELKQPLPGVPDALSKYPLSLTAGGIHLRYRGGDGSGLGRAEVAQVTRHLALSGIEYVGIDIRDSSLDDIFVGLVEESA